MGRRPYISEDDQILKPRPPKRHRQNKQKNVHKLDSFELIDLFPKTENQKKMFEEFYNDKNLLSVGSAGTGKTIVALYLALQKLITNGIDKIIIVRSAVSLRSQGHLPGSIAEKEEIYSLPYKQMVNFLFHNDTAWEVLTKRGYIQFLTTSYIRGITFENVVIIADEIQNLETGECESLLTRLGNEARIIMCGDIRQEDLSRKREITCHNWLVKLIGNVPDYFSIINFTRDDIVRSELVKQIIIALEDMENNN